MIVFPNRRQQSSNGGFTIVELLIVIVVIAILAAISIVAYNGIQNRARASAASSALNQAAKRLALFTVDNSESYPASSAAFFTEIGANTNGVKDNVSYQYSVNNSASPKTYCVTATVESTSYLVSESSGPAAGSCAGHGSNGVAPITNLATNPNAESNANGTGPVGANGAAITRVTDVKRSGTGAFRYVANGTSSGFTHTTAITPGSTFRYSAYLYATTSVATSMYGQTYVNGTYTGISPQSGNTSVTLPANTWTRVSWTGTHPAGAGSASIGFLTSAGAGTTVYVDDVIITQGTNDYAYADGYTANWVWNGTPNSATSTGPPL